jgi:CDGSH-type Zn-finger protein
MTAKTILLQDHEQPQRATLTIKAGERLALCRCWQSKTFPLCDGAHRAVNEEQGCCLGPVIVSA